MKIIKIFTSVVFLFCALYLAIHFAIANKNLKLIFALDLVRHGDRAPYKYMPQITSAWDKKEIGKLTYIGKKESELLGKKFHNYYIENARLLPKNLKTSFIHIRSTDYQRTRETAKGILNGMFEVDFDKIKVFAPPVKQDIFNNDNYNKIRSLNIKGFEKYILAIDKSLIFNAKKQLEEINHKLELNSLIAVI